MAALSFIKVKLKKLFAAKGFLIPFLPVKKELPATARVAKYYKGSLDSIVIGIDPFVSRQTEGSRIPLTIKTYE